VSRRQHAPPAGEGGFTLVELSVATLLLLLVLLMATQLLLETQRIFVRMNAEAQNPIAELAWAQLRSDVHKAVALPGGLVGSGGRLDLAQPSGTVRYLRMGEDLQRLVLAPDGTTILGRRTLLRGVVSWNWQSLAGVLMIEITHRAQEIPRGAQLVAPPQRQVEQTLETRSFWFAPRGGVHHSW
jgi:hypothetical protein